MKVLFIEGDMSRRGGTERMTSMLSNLLSDTHDIYVMSLHFRNGEIAFPLNEKVHHYILYQENVSHSMLGMIHRLRKFICQHQIERVINVDTGMGIYGVLSAVGTGAKVVTWEHSNFYNNWGSQIFPYLRWFAVKFSNAFVVLTEKDRSNYIAHIKTKTPIEVIPNPVEHRQPCYDIDSKMILSAGMLVPIKGYDTAIEVAKKVFSKRSDWKWVICGEGPEREHLEDLILEAGLEHNVFLPGNTDNMEEIYQRAAIFVMTSKMEGLPMVLLEAKSWGIPIVSFDIMTGPSDIVQDGKNGFLIAIEDVDAMSDKILQLISERDLRKQFSDKSRLELEKFSLERVEERWETVLTSL